MKMRATRTTLHLASTFRSSRNAYDSIDTCVVGIERDGIVAYGEGTPAHPFGESLESVLDAIDAEGAGVLGDLRDADGALERIAAWPAPSGARMALDGAVHDWLGKSVGRSTWDLFGHPRTLHGATGFTVGIADLEGTVAAVRAAPPVGALKVKVGPDGDIARVEAIREVSDLPMRVDPNGAWTLDVAATLTPRLRKLGVDLVEQPFGVDALDDYRRYREVPGRLPVLLDESCSGVDSVRGAADLADGVVVKLSKAGGVVGARRVVEAARAEALVVMLSCDCESELALSQAALLAPLADRIDLDSQFLLRDPPFGGLGLEAGRIVQGDAPGLGVVARTLPA